MRKAWLGFGRTLYVMDTTCFDDILLRVWELDPNATEGVDIKGRPSIKLSAHLPVNTRTKIKGIVQALNGGHVPTAAEIEADAVRPPAPEPCRAIVPYKSPAVVKSPLVTPAVICLPAPFVATVWCETMAA